MRDFEAYYAAGAAANAHVNPYGTQLWSFEQRIDPHANGFALLPFVSPPVVLPLFRALALMPVAIATSLWRTLLVACIAALVMTTLRFCKVRIAMQTILAGACIAIGFGPLTSALALGQLALVAYAAAAISLAAAFAAIFVWLQPNIALCVLAQARWKPALWCFLGLVLTVFSSNQAYAQAIRQHTDAERLSAIQITPLSILHGLGASPHVASVLAIVIAIAAAAAIGVALLHAQRPLQTFWIGSLLLPFFVPFLHEHNLIVAFMPAMAALLLTPQRAWPYAAIAVCLCAIDWLGLAQRPDGAIQTALLTFALLFGAASVRNDIPLRTIGATTAIVLCGIGLAGMLAAANPMPVWPDGMQALAITHFSSAAQAWKAEQAATGLFAVNPAWSALRALSLLGCAALAAIVAFALDIDVHHVVERSHRYRAEIA